MEVRGSSAIIMTETGEFARVRRGSASPICGEEYEGYEAKDVLVFRKAFIAAAAAVFIFILGIMDYYNPVKAVEIDMNSKIMLKLNRWNRVITASAPDKAGETILSKTKIKNTTLDNAVDKLMLEAKKEKLIKSFSEVKVNPVKGNVDVSSIRNSIPKDTEVDKVKKENIKQENNIQNPPKANVSPNNEKSNDNGKSNAENKSAKPDNSKNKVQNSPNNNSSNINDANKTKSEKASDNSSKHDNEANSKKSNKGADKAEGNKKK